MGGKVWSLAEEKHFWRWCMPRSHKRVKRDWEKYHAMTPEERDEKKFEVMEWSEIAKEMYRWATKDSGVARREYTTLSCFEHFYLNVAERGPRSPNIGGMAEPYIQQFLKNKLDGFVDTKGDPSGHRFERKFKSENYKENKPAAERKPPRVGAAQRRVKKMRTRSDREEAANDEGEGSGVAPEDDAASAIATEPEIDAPANEDAEPRSVQKSIPHAFRRKDISTPESPQQNAATQPYHQHNAGTHRYHQAPDREYGGEYGPLHTFDGNTLYPVHASHTAGQATHPQSQGHASYDYFNHSQQYQQSSGYSQHHRNDNYSYQHPHHYRKPYLGHQDTYSAYYDVEAATNHPRSFHSADQTNRNFVAQREDSSTPSAARTREFSTTQAAEALIAFQRHTASVGPVNVSTSKVEERSWAVEEPAHAERDNYSASYYSRDARSGNNGGDKDARLNGAPLANTPEQNSPTRSRKLPAPVIVIE